MTTGYADTMANGTSAANVSSKGAVRSVWCLLWHRDMLTSSDGWLIAQGSLT